MHRPGFTHGTLKTTPSNSICHDNSIENIDAASEESITADTYYIPEKDVKIYNRQSHSN